MANDIERTGGAVVPANSNDVEVLEAVPLDMEARLRELSALAERIRSGEIVLGPSQMKEIARRAGDVGGLVEKIKGGAQDAKEYADGLLASVPEVAEKAAEFGLDGIVGRIMRRKGIVSAKVNQIRIGIIFWLGKQVAKDLDITELPSFMQKKAA